MTHELSAARSARRTRSAHRALGSRAHARRAFARARSPHTHSAYARSATRNPHARPAPARPTCVGAGPEPHAAAARVAGRSHARAALRATARRGRACTSSRAARRGARQQLAQAERGVAAAAHEDVAQVLRVEVPRARRLRHQVRRLAARSSSACGTGRGCISRWCIDGCPADTERRPCRPRASGDGGGRVNSGGAKGVSDQHARSTGQGRGSSVTDL